MLFVGQGREKLYDHHRKFASTDKAIFFCQDMLSIEYFSLSHEFLPPTYLDTQRKTAIKISRDDQYIPIHIAASPNHITIIAQKKENSQQSITREPIQEVFVITTKDNLTGKIEPQFEEGEFGNMNRRRALPYSPDMDPANLYFHHKPDIDDRRVTDIKMVASGYDFTMLLDGSGNVWTWGDSASALGTGKLRREPIPYPIYFKNENSVASTIDFITCGNSFTAAIDKDNNLFMFGDNYYGQCGKDPKYGKVILKPEMVPTKFKVYNVACGLYHAMCVADRFRIYTWGNNSNGQLGHGDRQAQYFPREVESMQGICCSVIACGANNSMAFDDIGTVYGWGNNSYHKMGMGPETVMKVKEIEAGIDILKPIKLNFYKSHDCPEVDSLFSDEYFVQVDLNNSFSVGLTNKNRLFSWGKDFERQQSIEAIKNSADFPMGLYLKLKMTLVQPNLNPEEAPKKPHESYKVEKVYAGKDFSLAKTSSGEVIVWGSNDVFQHGTDLEEIKDYYSDYLKTKKVMRKKVGKVFVNMSTLPHFVERFSTLNRTYVTSVAAGFKHVVVIEKMRAAYAWGENKHGELGIANKIAMKKVPTRINSVSGMNLVDCVASRHYTMLLTDEGTVLSCGSNQDGKLGIAKSMPGMKIYIPTEIEGLKYAKKIAAGPNHAMAICSKNVDTNDNIFFKLTDEKHEEHKKKSSAQTILYCWGNGFFGQLGNKKLDNSLVPVQVNLTENFEDISCGDLISGAITKEGKLFLWGEKKSLPRMIKEASAPQKEGKDDDEDISVPTQYNREDIKFKSLSLGNQYHCAIDSNNKLYSWGSFSKDGNASNKDIMTEVRTGSSSQKCSQVSVGRDHAVMVFQKTVFSWGLDNHTGRLGDTLIIKQIADRMKKRRKGKKDYNAQSLLEEGYKPEIVQNEPKPLHIIEFLTGERVRSKRKDNELTGKSSTAKTTTQNDETRIVSISGSGFDSQLYEQKINLDDSYLYYIYENAEKTFNKIDYQMRTLKKYESAKNNALVRMKYLLFKRITEHPFENIKLRSESTEQKPKPLSSPEKVHLYNTLFTGLQLHPCLLVDLISYQGTERANNNSLANILTKENFRDLVISVFGAMHGDERKEHLYLTVLEKVLEWEIGEDLNSEDVYFFRLNQFQGENENEKQERRELHYSNLLIEHVLNQDLRYRLALEEIYYHLEEEITDKMKNVDRDMRNFVFSYRDDDKKFKTRYASDTSNWKEEEFNKRADNLMNLFIDKNGKKGAGGSSGSIIDIMELNLSNFIRKMLLMMNRVFSKKFKDYKNKEKVSTIYWGYLIKPLANIVVTKLDTKRKKNKRQYERFARNFEDILLFFMHYATSTQIKGKEEKWIARLNKYVLNAKGDLSTKMVSAMTPIVVAGGAPGAGFGFDMASDGDSANKLKIRNLELYVSRVMQDRPERISVSLLNVVKVCKIVDKQKHLNELYRGFINQVGDDNFLLMNPHYFGDDRVFNFTLLPKQYIMDDFISIRRCQICDCFAPAAFINPESAATIIERCEVIKKNSDLDIYMKYLGTTDPETIRQELRGKAKPQDIINQENLTKILMNQRSSKTQDEVIKIKKMLNLVKERKNEFEISVNELNDFAYQNTGDEGTILEPLFLTLREKTVEKLKQRHSYFNRLDTLNKKLNKDILRILDDYQEKVDRDLTYHGEVKNGKKVWNVYRKVEMNLMLGFANWCQVDNFEKENKFVKKLRHSIYQQGVSRLLYQNLTKKEKSKISTSFDLDKNEIKELINLKRFKETIRKNLLVNVTVDDEQTICFNLLYQDKGFLRRITSFSFDMETTYQLRKKMSEIDQKSKKSLRTKKDEKAQFFQLFNNGFEFLNKRKLVDLLTKAENLNLIYQQIDYLEDISINSKPIQSREEGISPHRITLVSRTLFGLDSSSKSFRKAKILENLKETTEKSLRVIIMLLFYSIFVTILILSRRASSLTREGECTPGKCVLCSTYTKLEAKKSTCLRCASSSLKGANEESLRCEGDSTQLENCLVETWSETQQKAICELCNTSYHRLYTSETDFTCSNTTNCRRGAWNVKNSIFECIACDNKMKPDDQKKGCVDAPSADLANCGILDYRSSPSNSDFRCLECLDGFYMAMGLCLKMPDNQDIACFELKDELRDHKCRHCNYKVGYFAEGVDQYGYQICKLKAGLRKQPANTEGNTDATEGGDAEVDGGGGVQDGADPTTSSSGLSTLNLWLVLTLHSLLRLPEH